MVFMALKGGIFYIALKSGIYDSKITRLAATNDLCH